MALLQWQDRYSVGNAAVDHEHKELINLINHLAETKVDHAGFFGDLHRAISAHFALEERLMREHGYDQFGAHKADHERLLDEIRDIMDRFDEGELGDLQQCLDAWFSRHFETHDARLHHALGTPS